MKIRIVPALTPELVNTNQIAERFNVTRLTVMNWIYAGKLEARKIGGRWKVTPEALDRFTNKVPEWGLTAQRLRAPKKIGRPPKPKTVTKPVKKFDQRKYKAQVKPAEF